jgi:hypothetical protein
MTDLKWLNPQHHVESGKQVTVTATINSEQETGIK